MQGTGSCRVAEFTNRLAAADVANAFGTSVGSRTLKLKWAVLIAAIMETCGAVFLGGSVASTIRGGEWVTITPVR